MADILTYSEIIEQMKAYLIANQDLITDFNENSALDTQLQAFAAQIAQAYSKMSGSFKKQFEQIPFQFFQFDRKQPAFASTTVVFSRDAAGDEVVIPIGTIISDIAGNLFTTTEEATILSGETLSNAVAATANETGSQTNGTIGSVTILVTSVNGVNAVTNNIAVSGGRDKESLASYFRRFTEYILGLQGGNTYSIKSRAEAVPDIQSAFVDEHFPPLSGIYNFTVYVDDGSGSTPQSLLDFVYLVLDGNDTEQYQGVACGGINFRVLSASLVSINVVTELDLDPAKGDEVLVKSQAENAIINYLNSLEIGRDVLYSDINRILKNIQNVYNINTLTLNGSDNDIAIAADEVARQGTITVTFSAVHPR